MDSLPSKHPLKVQSLKEAEILFECARDEEMLCCVLNKLAKQQVLKAIAEADLAKKNLHSTRLQLGFILNTMETSGIKLPHPEKTSPLAIVESEGG